MSEFAKFERPQERTGHPIRLIVHVGMHKSGSTAIQVAAQQEQEELLKQGVFYPLAIFPDIPDQHSEIAFNLTQGQSTTVAAALKKVEQQARELGAKTVLLSGEELCKLSPEDVATFRDISSLFFENLQFIVIVRNRENVIISAYKHHLRYSRTNMVFNEMVGNEFIDPEQIIKNWRRNFSDNYRVIHYDSICDKLVPNFFKNVLDVNVVFNRRENYSLDLLTLTIYNLMLKEWSSPEIDALMWRFINQYPTNDRFSMEEGIKRSLSEALPKSGWDIIELPADSLIGASSEIRSNFNPVEVSERMIGFFTMLRDHFREAKAGSDMP